MTSTVDVLPVVAPAVGVPGPPQGRWTYDAYAAIPEDGLRYEVIDGVLYVTPRAGYEHQNSVMEIVSSLRIWVKQAGLGIVLVAPFDVELWAGGDVVEPDVLVVLEQHRSSITATKLIGPPDLVIEVSSPSTRTYDRRHKMDAYARAGVPEYWLVETSEQTVELLNLEGGAYLSAGVFHGQALLPSRVVPNFPVQVQQFFV